MAQVIEIAVDLEKNPSVEGLKRQIDMLNARSDTHICRINELEKKQKNEHKLLKERIEFLEGALKASLEQKQTLPPASKDETDEPPTEEKTPVNPHLGVVTARWPGAVVRLTPCPVPYDQCITVIKCHRDFTNGFKRPASSYTIHFDEK